MKLIIGMKVNLPKTKLGKNYQGNSYREATRLKQDFMYYNGINDAGDYMLSYRLYDGGDFYNIDEIIPYGEVNYEIY